MFAGQQASMNTSCWPAVVYFDSEGCISKLFGLFGFVSCASYDYVPFPQCDMMV